MFFDYSKTNMSCWARSFDLDVRSDAENITFGYNVFIAFLGCYSKRQEENDESLDRL